MSRKKVIAIIIISVISIISILLLLVPIIVIILPWSIMYVYAIFLPAPPYPQVEKEEFPFQLVYECEDKQRTIEDTLICEFSGMECDSNFKKYRTWTYRLKSGQDAIILWTGKNSEGEKEEICFEVTPEYYMGDDELCSEEEYPGQKESERYYIEVLTYYDPVDGDIEETHLEPKELFNKYGIKIISWKCRPPIKNTFK